MSTRLSTESFIEVVRRSGLVEADRLQRLVQSQVSGPAESVAEQLIQLQAITRWQADKLLQGKHKGYFLGKYRLLSLLGKGGMSSVYLAEHTLMRRRCAIKVLPSKRVADSSYLGRFHREAQAVASLDHPNIVRAYDVDHQSDGANDIHFLVMEFVEGSSLLELVQKQGRLPFNDVADFARQAAQGLDHAHRAGMVHRDIKPGNLLVDLRGVVKILDLGLARFFSDTGDDALTIQHDEKVLGTADYLAPEQALDSHSVDARADLYSLGCTMYFLLTSNPPFTEGTLAQRLMAHQTREPTAIETLRPETPPTLTAIVRKMMAKRADDRYATARDAADALHGWLVQNADVEWKKKHRDFAALAVPLARAVVAQPVAALPVAMARATAQPVVPVVTKPATIQPEPALPEPAKPVVSKSDSVKTAAPMPADVSAPAAPFSEIFQVPSNKGATPNRGGLADLFGDLTAATPAAAPSPTVPAEPVVTKPVAATAQPSRSSPNLAPPPSVPPQGTPAVRPEAGLKANTSVSAGSGPLKTNPAKKAPASTVGVGDFDFLGGATAPAASGILPTVSKPGSDVDTSPFADLGALPVKPKSAILPAKTPAPVVSELTSQSAPPMANVPPDGNPVSLPVPVVPPGKKALSAAPPAEIPDFTMPSFGAPSEAGSSPATPAPDAGSPFSFGADSFGSSPTAPEPASIPVVARSQPDSALQKTVSKQKSVTKVPAPPVISPEFNLPPAAPTPPFPPAASRGPGPLDLFGTEEVPESDAAPKPSAPLADSGSDQGPSPGEPIPDDSNSEAEDEVAEPVSKKTARFPRIGLPTALGAGGGGLAVLALLVWWVFFTSASTPGGPAKKPRSDQPAAPWAPSKRKLVVGPEGEFSTIVSALVAVRDRFVPAPARNDPADPNRQLRDEFVILVKAGTYEEKISIDATRTAWPEGIVVRAEGAVILKPAGTDPVVRLKGITRLTLEGLQIDATGRTTGIELRDFLTETRLVRLKVNGYSEAGISLTGVQGLSFTNNQLRIVDCELSAAKKEAVGIRLGPGSAPDEQDCNNIVIEGCRLLKPHLAGVRIGGKAPYLVEIRRNLFTGLTSGVQVTASGSLRDLVVANCTFHQCQKGVLFDRQPAAGAGLTLRRNLFLGNLQGDIEVAAGLNAGTFSSALQAGGGELNWTDRTAPPGPKEPDLWGQGQRSTANLSFLSTDPSAKDFLKPKAGSPLANVGTPSPEENAWIGARAP